ncbi:MAG: hypothetical protein ABJM19_08485 [Marinobacter sp.]|uniref:hypothetical protein n=1 Tax=Marinobacter sp. TaxID=50741 RepID=UPI0032969B06
MNRYKAEEARKRREARAGLSELEIKRLDVDEDRESLITDLARKIHIERFPEEYDHYHDSIADAADRSRGINPMSVDYIAKIAEKRRRDGVAPLGDDGMPVSTDSWEIAYREAEAQLRGGSDD